MLTPEHLYLLLSLPKYSHGLCPNIAFHEKPRPCGEGKASCGWQPRCRWFLEALQGSRQHLGRQVVMEPAVRAKTQWDCFNLCAWRQMHPWPFPLHEPIIQPHVLFCFFVWHEISTSYYWKSPTNQSYGRLKMVTKCLLLRGISPLLESGWSLWQLDQEKVVEEALLFLGPDLTRFVASTLCFLKLSPWELWVAM